MFNRMQISLAWQQLIAQWRAGDVRVLLLALIVSVAAITSVSFFTHRIAQHLNSQAALMLGGDMVMLADHPIPSTVIDQAELFGLNTTITAEFPSMVIKGEKSQLAEIKALHQGFPLRGSLYVKLGIDDEAKILKTIPRAGEVWIAPRLVNLLAIDIGDLIKVGEATFKVAGILVNEPSRGGDMFSFAPRLMMNANDLEKTGLIQFGSRVKYQLLVAGDINKVNQFKVMIAPQLQRGERVQDLKTARPEIRSALDKAEIFLGLAALVSVILSVTAMLLASEPYVARNIDNAALLRCFGASKSFIQNLLLWQCGFIALLGAIIGSALGFVLQEGLAYFAGSLFLEQLPAPNMQPVFIGFAVSFSTLFALMIPNINAIKHSPVIHILRRELTVNMANMALRFIPGFVLIAMLILLLAQSIKLAIAVILSFLIVVLVCGVFAYLFASLLYQVSHHNKVGNGASFNMIKLGFANLKRKQVLTTVQVVGFSLSAMVLILLSIVKTDLLNNWQASLPLDAPNRFMINIQPDQVSQVKDLVQKMEVEKPELFPMIRGRLIAKNGQEVSADSYNNERARRLITREFNLSMAGELQSDNRLIEGVWWGPENVKEPIVSIEQDIAKTLDIKLGDQLTYEIAGRKIVLTVASIRLVDWDSMRANFFALTPPKTLQDFPTSFMTALYLAKDKEQSLNQFSQALPNVTVIDIASIMEQVRGIMNKMTLAVAYVFGLCVVAGLVVLYAALIATRATRIREASLLRVFGASRKQVGLTMLTEYFGIALLAAMVAVLIANALAFYVSTYLLDITFNLNIALNVSALLTAVTLIPLAAWLVIRQYLNISPKQLLNSI